MAHTVVGVDLGAYSVKVAVLEAGFKRSRLVAFHERVVPPAPPHTAGEPEEPGIKRAARAAAELIAERGLDGEFVFVALPGDQCVLRLLSFPFADARQIAQTISYEFEGQIPYDLADLIYQHRIVDVPPRAAGSPAAGSEEPAPAEGAKALCAGARRETITQLLEALRDVGIEPRGIGISPLLYGALVAPADDQDVRLLVDIGHLRTNIVALYRGRQIFARTLSRGGAQVTRAIARALSLGEPDATAVKHERARVALAPTADPACRAASVEAAALVRDLRQTQAALLGVYNRPITEVLVCGGGSRLGGLEELLASEIGVPVSAFRPQLDEGVDPLGLTEANSREITAALALGLGGATGHLDVDLRRGEFAHQSDYSFLRLKATHLVTCLLALLACMAIDAFAALGELRKEQALLDQRFANVSAQVLPGKKLTPEQVVAMVQANGKVGVEKDSGSALPKESAARLLETISKAMPPGDKVKLDVTDLEIQPKSITIRGTTDSASNVDTIASALKTPSAPDMKSALSCIEGVSPGAITDANGGGKEFELTITHHCE